jgi:Kef-type K+ transport system membrane component KefB
LHLDPKDLLRMLRKVTLVALVSSIVFAGIGFSVGQLFDYTIPESLIIGAAMMFSSTIIGLKLLPTTMLQHHQHTGEVMISVLLMQDIIAIIIILFLHSASDSTGLAWTHFAMVGLSLPALIIFAFVCERYILSKLLARFDAVQEYVFLLAIGWCMGIAQLATFIGLPSEIGAFIAGVSIASGPIAFFIAENLKPLRDFFLVLFFFAIGANFDTAYLPIVVFPAVLLAALVLLIKPWLFRLLLRRVGENAAVSKEVGVRLGQSSEFSLLVAYWAVTATPALISNTANYLIQAMTILTFIVSCYWVVWRYPTPLGLSSQLNRD